MRTNPCFIAVLVLSIPFTAIAQETSYSGLDNHLSSLYRLSNAKTLSISPENPTGEKGKGGTLTEGTGAKAARDLGKGWKISPSVVHGSRDPWLRRNSAHLDDADRQLAILHSAHVLGW